MPNSLAFLLDLFRALRKFIKHPLRYSGQLPSFGHPFNAITHFRQLFGKSGMERCFKIRRITF